MPLELITPPALEPVSYAEVLHHLRMDLFDEGIDEDSQTYLNRLTAAIRRACEAFTNRAFITQTWKYYLDKWPTKNYIELPKPPLQSVTSITVITDDALPTINYLTDTASIRGRIILVAGASWPDVTLSPMNPIQIEFIAGYGDTPEDIPDGIKHAILLQIGDLWDNREDFRDGQLSRPSEMLLWPYRVFF